MSVDRSLKLKGTLVRHRNVLTRAERMERLKEEERWQEGDSLFSLPKVANRKISVVKKKAEAKAKAEGEASVLDQAAAAQPAGMQGKAAAPAGKAAAPAGAGKAAPASGKTAGAGKAAPASKLTGQGKPGGGRR